VTDRTVKVVPRRYLDSIALLALTAELADVEGVTDAAVAMATPDGRERLRERGYVSAAIDDASPNDLVLALTGPVEACARAFVVASTQLEPKQVGIGDATGPDAPHTIDLFFRRGGVANIAVVSVPGRFAAATARVAIARGMHTMIFSDNVTIEDEIALKDEGGAKGVLVMGPDCGTAILNGVPLGFANAVRRGPVAVIGASGTGMQEVTSRLHRLGLGVSQAIGCGGRDVTDAVGARTMVAALGMIANDPNTKAVVLVSKPPGPLALRRVVDACAPIVGRGIPVVAAFVGLGAGPLDGTGMSFADSLAGSADLVARLLGVTPLPSDDTCADDGSEAVLASAQAQSPERRVVHGAFCGGTFASEARSLLGAAGIREATDGHSLIDFGDDEYTVGRPHPMIDSSVRDARIRWALAQPSTSVVLVDVVLGHGASLHPGDDLVSIVGASDGNGSGPIVIAHVCGTDDDPQCRRAVVDELQRSGVVVADSNAEAARLAARCVGAERRYG
jgi:FdrA protein